jgi:hypothetical protein
LAGKARFDWNHDAREMNVNAMLVTGIANCKCLQCGEPFVKPRLNRFPPDPKPFRS